MRQQQQQQQQQQQSVHYSQPYPATSTPVKPSVSPKPGSYADQDRRYNNASPASYSTISNESSISYHQPHHVITPPPPPRTSSTFSQQHQSNFAANRSQFEPQEDLYARPREPNQYYTASSAGSTASTTSTVKKQFMKPSEFYSEPKSSPAPPKGGISVLPTGTNSFGKPYKMAQPLQQQHHVQRSSGDDRQSEDYQEEYSHYDSGPISSEEVYETTTADGGVSLKRIFTKQQTSTTKNVVSSTRKVVSKRDGSN